MLARWRGYKAQLGRSNMTKYSADEKARILQASRETIERLSTLREPVEAPVELDVDPLTKWRADANAFDARRARAHTERKCQELHDTLVAHFEQRLATEVTGLA